VKQHVKRRALQAAFPHTIPILAGFGFLGMSFGFLMRVSGHPAWLPVLMSVIIYAGSMQFVTVELLAAAFHPLQALLMALMVNARHLFYGISLLRHYEGMGLKRPYLIFGMTDETFSIHYAAKAPEQVDRGWFLFFITLLNHLYWVGGTLAGSLLGSVLRFNTQGLDFVMTAMFVVILLEQVQKKENRLSVLVGLGASAVCLVIFGAESFVIPAMAAILALLLVLRKSMERTGDAA
jgi:4-azaleucine resistance transporter AzlC